MRVMIADDDPLVVSSLEVILESAGFVIAATANSGREAVSLYPEAKPDVVLMDIRMEDQDGIEATQAILQRDPAAKILLLTTFTETEYIRHAMAVGARGYVLKQHYKDLPAAIRTVMEGHVLLDRGIADKAIVTSDAGDLSSLTEREREIVERLAAGKSNREISEELYLSEGTVRNHLSNILLKLGLRDRTQLVVYYYNGRRLT